MLGLSSLFTLPKKTQFLGTGLEHIENLLEIT